MHDSEAIRPQEQAEIERNLRQLASEDYGEVEQAKAFLFAHATESHARLVDYVQSSRPGAQHAALVLAQIGKAESVDVLRKAAQQGSPHAATALGRHPAPAAVGVLVELLGTPSEEVVAESCRALANRGDPKACDALKAHLGEPNDNRRYYFTMAAVQLKCLKPNDLSTMLSREKDRHVRRVLKNALGLPLAPEEVE